MYRCSRLRLSCWRQPARPTRYYFVIRARDGRYDDPSGSDLADIGAATAYAHRIIEELKEGAHPRDYVTLDEVRVRCGLQMKGLLVHRRALVRAWIESAQQASTHMKFLTERLGRTLVGKTV